MIEFYMKQITKKLKKITWAAIIFACFIVAFNPAHKAGAACCSCAATVAATDIPLWFMPPGGTVPLIDNHVTQEFIALRSWIVSILWEDNILPAMMLMAEQLTAVAMQQVEIIGAFLDAKHQLESQRLFQQLQARAHKEYHPSVGMCEFGSTTKSLAASERRAEYNAVLMSQRSLDRQLGNANTSAMYGNDLDKRSRLEQFKTVYCDPRDNNNGLGLMCKGMVDPPPGSDAERGRYNRDIDYTRTIDSPWTLNVDFTNATKTDHEEDVFALAANLYAHHVFARPPASLLEVDPTTDGMTDMQKKYSNMRSIIAKRSVAENSFNAITSMKSEGTAGSKDFMAALLEELGINPEDATALLGENPSYYAQMEVLTKKIYQNPDFYTNLYDKPVNVARKGVSLQAIGLMQKFDMFKSYLRSEASLSVLLELAVMDLQTEVENEINRLTGE